jgi:hypothetical protein
MQMKSLANKRFGRLIVIEFSHLQPRNPKGNIPA